MTQEEKLQKIDYLRELWKKAQTPVDKRILHIRALLLKWTLPEQLLKTTS